MYHRTRCSLSPVMLLVAGSPVLVAVLSPIRLVVYPELLEMDADNDVRLRLFEKCTFWSGPTYSSVKSRYRSPLKITSNVIEASQGRKHHTVSGNCRAGERMQLGNLSASSILYSRCPARPLALLEAERVNLNNENNSNVQQQMKMVHAQVL